jgi:DNA processing protein
VGSAAKAADAVVRARVWLSRGVEPGSGAVYRYVERAGPVAAVRQIRAGTAPAELEQATAARRHHDHVAEDLARAARSGLRVLVPEDDEWPAYVLLRMHTATARGVPGLAPPLMMWVRGQPRLDDLTERAVAIVGARAATPYGEYVAGDLAYHLAARGWTVVSGGALGIDAAAHRGALAAGGRTVAVIAGGLDTPYPHRNSRLFDQIAERGLLISEWPPGTAPQRHRFLLRNRLIAGLVAGSVVIEAGSRSGAKNTARHTRELGGTVMAVPGPVTSAMSVGCHQLVRECSARLVTSAADVLEEIGRIGDDLALPHEAESRVEDELDPAARRVLDGLEIRRLSSPEQVATAAGIPVGVVLRYLPVLELVGLAECDAGGWKLARGAVRRLRRH